jgi:hypothetical protein
VTIYQIDPVRDPRWVDFLQGHSRASVFHSPGWLEALRRTFGYEPVAFTTSSPAQELGNGLLFCLIDSPFTGRRLVSLPFSDHCEPLVDNPEDLRELLCFLQNNLKMQEWRYIEIRPLTSHLNNSSSGFMPDRTFYFHKLNLSPLADTLFRSFHRDSVQRKIRRAERDGVSYAAGRSEWLLDKFYPLLLRTRRRHRLPPQPREWFRNLSDCLGDHLTIRVASREGQPIASILTLRYKNGIVYKYGCSDARFHNLGPVHLLLWKTIQEAKNDGLHELDMGRSDSEDLGLLKFKERWGATRAGLIYSRYPASTCGAAGEGRVLRIAKQFFECMPDSVLTATGKLLYKHIG